MPSMAFYIFLGDIRMGVLYLVVCFCSLFRVDSSGHVIRLGAKVAELLQTESRFDVSCWQ